MVEQQFKGMRIEYHILQSFPVTCLNRDDVGAPKTAVVGATTRARVSSQCWKRSVRQSLQSLGIKTATRTKNLKEKISALCVELGADQEDADNSGELLADLLIDNTLIFIGDSEVQRMVQIAQTKNFFPEIRQLKAAAAAGGGKAKKDDTKKKIEVDIEKALKKVFDASVDGIDVVLFGRMIAKATSMNIEAACNFSHAISTHKVTNELEFFTAVDDEPSQQGSAHMGTLEYNAATYYRYIALDLGVLEQHLDLEGMKKSIEAFTKALYLAVPNARQNTMAGLSSWDFARVLMRKGQGVQVSFEEPVKPKNGGFLGSSIDRLKSDLELKERQAGSLFGKYAQFELSAESNLNIDDLVAGLINNLK